MSKHHFQVPNCVVVRIYFNCLTKLFETQKYLHKTEFYVFLNSNLDMVCPGLIKQIYFTRSPRDPESFQIVVPSFLEDLPCPHGISWLNTVSTFQKTWGKEKKGRCILLRSWLRRHIISLYRHHWPKFSSNARTTRDSGKCSFWLGGYMLTLEFYHYGRRGESNLDGNYVSLSQVPLFF